MSTTVIELENKDIVVKMSGQGPIGPRGPKGDPGEPGPSEWGVIQGNISDQTDLQNALDAKANVGDSYTKAEDDALLAQKADAGSVYTKTETDSLLADKADSDTVYTKTETDTLLDAKADVGDSYTKAEEDALLAVKANSADVYTKAQTDTLLADKADADTVYTKTETDSLLSNKADSDSVYTKTETDALLADKAPVILNSASGSIASFSDGSASPVTALSISIDPVQDLHGQDAPYPAGGGKNLAKPLSGTVNGITFTLNADGTIQVSGTFTVDAWTYLRSDSLTISESGFSVGDQITIGTSSCQIGIEFYDSNNTRVGALAKVNGYAQATIPDNSVTWSYLFYANANGATGIAGTSINQAVKFLVSKDSNEWTPYSNVCPISGHTSAVVTRTGKNLFDKTTVTTGKCLTASGAETTKSWGNYSDYIRVSPNTAYFISHGIGTNALVTGCYYDAYKNYISGINISGSDNISASFTTPSSCAYIRINVHNDHLNDCQLELGSTASAYEPYQGTSVTIDLDGTRYGGTLNVLTGEMTVDMVSVTFDGSDDEGWLYNSGANGIFYKSIADMKIGFYMKGFCNWMPLTNSASVFGIRIGASDNSIYCYQVTTTLPSINDLSTWKTYLASNNLTVVYTLATPLTVQLTPSQISTLLGQNNLWADTGDVAVEYRADTKRYIDGVASATAKVTRQMIADSATADGKAPKSLATGDLIIVGDELRKATANIGNGSAITASNSTTATLADVIKALQ